jgi:hypothetical protein
MTSKATSNWSITVHIYDKVSNDMLSSMVPSTSTLSTISSPPILISSFANYIIAKKSFTVHCGPDAKQTISWLAHVAIGNVSSSPHNHARSIFPPPCFHISFFKTTISDTLIQRDMMIKAFKDGNYWAPLLRYTRE